MQRFEVSEQVAWRAATLIREYRRSHILQSLFSGL
jgi:hypothetical protein